MEYGPLDYALFIVVLATLPLDAWIGKVQLKALESAPERRLKLYGWLIAVQWTSCAAVAGLWLARAHPWSALLLGPVSAGRVALGSLVSAALLLPVLGMRRKAFNAVAQGHAHNIRFGSGRLEPLVPHTPRERMLWTVLSITAGVCEEVVYRGFAMMFIAHFTGVLVAVPLSALVFGLGHAYQGKNGVITSGVWGLCAGIIALLSGTLLPVIALHAAQDLLAGDLGYRIIRARAEYAAA